MCRIHRKHHQQRNGLHRLHSLLWIDRKENERRRNTKKALISLTKKFPTNTAALIWSPQCICWHLSHLYTAHIVRSCVFRGWMGVKRKIRHFFSLTTLLESFNPYTNIYVCLSPFLSRICANVRAIAEVSMLDELLLINVVWGWKKSRWKRQDFNQIHRFSLQIVLIIKQIYSISIRISK